MVFVAVTLRTKLSRLDPTRVGAPAGTEAPGGPAPAPSEPRADVLRELRGRMQAVLARTIPKVAPLPPVDGEELPFCSHPTAHGALHVRTQRLSPAHRTGRAPLACAVEADLELIALLALDPALAACSPRGALFLDTETTGLAGGAGTVAFLVGLAWFEGGATLVLEQLLVRALGEERPMLERVRERLAAASMLVTFNGKSFDMPLLRTRFVMARAEPAREPPHLDLLHVARRVHGKRVRRGCRLVALEREVLGFERIDDVPSGDVSARYLHFLRTGEAGALLGVIEHNAWDVVAMVALLGLYGEPTQSDLLADDLACIARTVARSRERSGALARAGNLAEAAVARDATVESLRARADIAKARGDRARALTDFETLAATVADPSVHLELAKLYEHWMRAPERALAWVERGTREPAAVAKRRSERLARKARQSKLALDER